MELREETLEHLRNEALLCLCREAVDEQLALVERQREELQSTRSPFPIFARRETKEAFSRSMRDVAENTAVLQQHLAQIKQVENRLLPLLRADIEAYLERASPEFSHVARNIRLIDVWQRKLRELADPIRAFAREVKEIREANPGAQRVRAMASARDLAQRIEAEHVTLSGIAQNVDESLRVGGSPLTLPPLVELRRVNWVQRLAVAAPTQVELESAQVELETRKFLAEGQELACAQANECHSACRAFADQYLETYWNQLRAYSREHCIGDRNLDEALATLTECYVEADLLRCQQEITVDPFLINR